MAKFAFIFPGQGSQAVGMLNGFIDNSIVKQTLLEASDILKFDIKKLIEEGPKENLDITTNTQPIMLAVTVAFYRAWIEAGGAIPSIVAGHSLGEYSALVAAGVIKFKDALPLVRFRAIVMQEAVPVGIGSMAAILGLPDDQVRTICAEAAQNDIVEAVNFNAPAQIVIAGHKVAVERACEVAKIKGAKRAVILPVSAPFHSSLLKPAADRLRHYLSGVTFAAPQILLVNNVDAEILDDPADIKDALARQAASPVRWVETLQKISKEGIIHVIECGPGKVLTGLTKRINSNLIANTIVDQASLNKILELLA